VRSTVKKAATIAVANCYGLKLSKVAEDQAARDSLANLVARLLDQNRFLWYIPLPEYEDRDDPVPDDDVVGIHPLDQYYDSLLFSVARHPSTTPPSHGPSHWPFINTHQKSRE
jgi:hypothetical protein